PVPMFLSAARYDDETGAGLIGISMDVSGIRATNDMLNRESAFLNSLLQSTGDALIAIGMDQAVLFQNDRYLELFNMPPDLLTDLDRLAERREVLASRTIDPTGFLSLFDRINADPEIKIRDEIELVGGEVLECYSAPVIDQDQQRV